jgi:hypothetical protein
MIYRNLRKLPMVILIEIIESGDVSLLSDEDSNIVELEGIWNYLFQQYQRKYNKQNSNKVFNLSREIEYLDKKYFEIKLIIEALKFDVYPELISILRDYGYRFRDDFYNEDLVRVQRESEGIVQKINQLRESLPKVDINVSDEVSVINIMASYSAVLGYDFDFYTISVEKYHALEIQVKQKIAAVDKNNAKKI